MIKEYISNNKDRFLSELFDWLRIPSISADRKYKDDIRKAAEFLRKKLQDAGADKVELCETAGNPIVYAEKIIDPALPTVLGVRPLRCTTARPPQSLDFTAI